MSGPAQPRLLPSLWEAGWSGVGRWGEPGQGTAVEGGHCPRRVQGKGQCPLGNFLGLPLSLCPGAFVPWNRDIRQVIAIRREGWWIRSQEVSKRLEMRSRVRRRGWAAQSAGGGQGGRCRGASPKKQRARAGGRRGAWVLLPGSGPHDDGRVPVSPCPYAQRNRTRRSGARGWRGARWARRSSASASGGRAPAAGA